jgi:hypothetical protein
MASKTRFTKTGVKTAAGIFLFYVVFNLFNLKVFNFVPYPTKYTDGKSATSYIVAALGLGLLICVSSFFVWLKNKMLANRDEKDKDVSIGVQSLGYGQNDYN